MPARTVRIINEKGLHARASAKFVECVEGFEAGCEVRREGMAAPGNSIMGLLMLGAHCGTEIEIEATGPDAEALLAALEALVADRFGEEM